MAVLDDVLKQALGGKGSGDQASSLVKSVLDLLDDDETDGVQGLGRSFQHKGLGDVFSSWVETGPNRSISADELRDALGSRRVEQVAQRAGIPASAAPAVLASVLPAVIDKLTPDGKAAPRATLAARGKSLLESIRAGFGRAKPAAAETAPKPKADFSGVKSSSSSTAPAPASAGEETYTVVKGDSLSKIAKRFYGKASEWKRIYEANRQVIGDDPDLIRPGQKLRIPKA